jgi:hypothetical protein
VFSVVKSNFMPHPNPGRAGFDLVLRRPALVFAEIAWRWSFGLASLALLGLTCILFLSSIRVSESDMQLAHSGSPWIIADILARLIQANAAPLLRGFAVLVPGMAILWTIAASVGRLITVPPLVTPRPERPSTAFPALLAISFLRTALALALIAGYFGCAFLAAMVANSVGGDPQAQVQVSFLVFMPLFLILLLAWAVMNWFFSIAPIFAVRDSRPALASFADAVHLFSANKRDFLAIGSAYGLAKTIAIVIVTVAGIVLAIALSSYPPLMITVLIVVSLVYFAFADLLNLARLASYAMLAEIPTPEPAGQTTVA